MDPWWEDERDQELPVAVPQLLWLGRLAPKGRAVFVVHKNLGSDSLQSWLEREGWGAERLASRQGYRVLLVTRPGEK